MATGDPIWGGLAELMYANELSRPWASVPTEEVTVGSSAVQDPPAGKEEFDLKGSGHPDHPNEPDDGGADEQLEELHLDVGGQLSFAVGGKTPTTSSLRLVGGAVKLDGTLGKEQKVVLRVECEVTEVAFANERDSKTGNVVGCNRHHKAVITGLELVE